MRELYPAGKLHHGGERPCAGPQRQETPTHIRWELNGELDVCRWSEVCGAPPCSLPLRVLHLRAVVVGGQRCGPSSSSHGLRCLQRPMTVHLTRSATRPPRQPCRWKLVFLIWACSPRCGTRGFVSIAGLEALSRGFLVFQGSLFDS